MPTIHADIKNQADNRAEKQLRCNCYVIPPAFDAGPLIGVIVERMGKNAKVEVNEITPHQKWLIQARSKDGYIGRLVKRRPELMLIAIDITEGRLLIGITHTEKAPPVEAETGSPGAIKWMASMAAEATADLTEAAVTGWTEIWKETKTEVEIYEAIERYIISAWQTIKGELIDVKEAFQSRYVEEMNGIERVWLASVLESGEFLLAWLKTSVPTTNHTPAEWRYVLTSEKSLLAGFSRVRFEVSHALPAQPLVISDGIGKKTIVAGSVGFKALSENQGLWAEIAELPGKNRLERMREAARLNYLHGKTAPDCLAYAHHIMERVSNAERSLDDRLSLMMIKLYRDLPKAARKDPAAIPTLIEQEPELSLIADELTDYSLPDRWRDWAEHWGLRTLEQIAVARGVQGRRPKDANIARQLTSMIEANRRQALSEKKNAPLAVALDILYAENLILGENYREAEQILEKCLSSLPDESYLDLLPHGNSDLTRGEGGQELRIKILTLLSWARGTPSRPDPEITARLAGLQPLVIERLEQLALVADEAQKNRALTLIKGLSEKGMTPDKAQVHTRGQARPLSAQDIEKKIRHPAGREGTALRKLQNFIAAKKQPDHALLKTYAKRVNADEHPEIMSIIMDGAMILGLPALEAYISFGELKTGIRSYDSNPPFLLIGCDHLDSNTPQYLRPLEFRFQIGAELAHLRYKHERITSREIWEGAFDKAMSVIEFFPVIGGYVGKIGRLGKFAGHATEMANQLKNIQKFVNQAREISNTVQGLYQPAASNQAGNAQSDRERDLISAFREMQFTADRAALVICGAPLAAACSMFKVSSILYNQLPMAEEYGLTTLLSRIDEEGNLMFQDLAIRLASLFSFYLSHDYELLRNAAMPTTANHR